MFKTKVVDLFEINNFVSDDFLLISYILAGESCIYLVQNRVYHFLITFFTIKTKTTRPFKRYSEVNLYIFLR